MVTTSTYNTLKKALLKKKAEVTASPVAAEAFLTGIGLGKLPGEKISKPNSPKATSKKNTK